MKKGLITSILALTFTGLQAQPLPATPKLVVTLTIDQLRTDYMEAFSTLYGEKGFKRLMREGKVFYQTEFPFNGTDRASAIAAIYSGTTPSMNGIISQVTQLSADSQRSGNGKYHRSVERSDIEPSRYPCEHRAGEEYSGQHHRG